MEIIFRDATEAKVEFFDKYDIVGNLIIITNGREELIFNTNDVKKIEVQNGNK